MLRSRLPLRRVSQSSLFVYGTRIGKRSLTSIGNSVWNYFDDDNRNRISSVHCHRCWLSTQHEAFDRNDENNTTETSDKNHNDESPPILSRKEEKLRINRIRNAAKSIPYWLANDADCFSQTMARLNLDVSYSNTSNDDSNKINNNNENNGLLSEYRQMYMDSITSFSKLLTEKPLSPKMKYCLNELVEAGFHNLKWSKIFRQKENVDKNLVRHEKIVRRLKKRLNERHKKLNKQERSLSILEAAYEKENENESSKITETSNRKKNSTSMGDLVTKTWTEIWDSLDHSNSDLIDDDDVDEKQEKSLSTAKKLQKQRNRVMNARQAVDAVTKEIARLEKSRIVMKSAIQEDEYNRALVVVKKVMQEVCAVYASYLHDRHSLLIEHYKTLDAKTDLTKPHEWYMHTRLDRRKIIFHGGPTNSGKTYEALQRLKHAKRGLYLGPLRLLAAEVYETLTHQGVYTCLYTGQEQREIPFNTHAAATVEMAFTNEDFDVVVIDEIQMIADPHRGAGWTKALLGIRCKEIHVCGGLEAQNIVERIAKVCGDEFVLKSYDRFSELEIAPNSLALTSGEKGSYNRVQPGDCIVAFSRNDIFAIKREIEESTKFKCCVIYGSLPPETRTEQARLFNDQDSGYDILVASDAIGMGLNLSIRRIIFNSMIKVNGDGVVRLDHSAVKQIAGRAGRRNSPFPVGEVTCRDPADMEYLHKCMSTDIPRIRKAGLLPTAGHIQHFSDALEQYGLGGTDSSNLGSMLDLFGDMAKTRGDFFICRQNEMKGISAWVDEIPLPLADKYTLCMAPVSLSNRWAQRALSNFARKYAAGEAPGLGRNTIPRPAKSYDHLTSLCHLHNELELFLWLSLRFPANFVEQQTALTLKERAIEYINEGLAKTSELKLSHCYINRDKKLRKKWEQTAPPEEANEEFGDNDDDSEDFDEEIDDVKSYMVN